MKRFVFVGIGIAVIVFGISMVFLSDQQTTPSQVQSETQQMADQTVDTKRNAPANMTAMPNGDQNQTQPDPQETQNQNAPLTTDKSTTGQTSTTDDSQVTNDQTVNGPIVKNGSVDIDAALSQRFVGDADAPVVMYDFSSLSCPHCADLHTQSLPPVKREYVDKGKLKVVFRDFPLNRAAMIAHTLARCVAPEKYAGALSILYDNQSRWMDKGNPTSQIISLLRITGLTEEEAEICINEQAIEDGILAQMRAGQRKYNISSTPTMVFENGPTIRGASSPERIGQIVQRLSNEQSE